MVKKYGVLIASILLFVAVNTSYFWAGRLGIIQLVAVLVMVGLFVLLVLLAIWQWRLTHKEGYANRALNWRLGLTGLLLGLTAAFPYGLIDYERWESEPLFEAIAVGGGNCTTILELHENGRFRDITYCFGISTYLGRYHISHDTIYFTEVRKPMLGKGYFNYALIKHLNTTDNGTLFRYYYTDDNIKGSRLKIKKNELKELQVE